MTAAHQVRFGVLLITAGFVALASGPREAQWQEVDDAMQKGLPRSAIEKLGPILEGAIKDRAVGEATKALVRRIALEGQIQGGKPEENIRRLQAELDKAPASLHPMLEAVLAHWYWQYYQQNQWRFLQRTATRQTPGADFTTWDLPRLFAEIDRHFQRALADTAELQGTPVTTFNEFLVAGTLPDRYRPTLYDFLVHQALDFYSSGAQAGARPQEDFDLLPESPVFGSLEEFLAWRLPAGESPVQRALALYQDLLRFHAADEDPTAQADADLSRLELGWNLAAGEGKTARYESALASFVNRWADHEISARALHAWARLRQQEDDPARAHALATRGLQSHPNAPGASLCHNLLQEIEAKSTRLMTERVWNNPWPTLDIHYRNLDHVWFRIVSADWETGLRERQFPPGLRSLESRKALLQRPPVVAWDAPLPPTADFKERVESLELPTTVTALPLVAGYYILLASHNPDFAEAENLISLTDFWVSDVALVSRPRAGQVEGFVLNARSGEPLGSAEVRAWVWDPQGQPEALEPVTTDEQGVFLVPSATRPGNILLLASHGGHRIDNGQWLSRPEKYSPSRVELTTFFTDRALYRPGQIIQYKGICLAAEAGNDRYEILAGRELVVVLRDPNGQEVARQKQRCNDYGSFTGSFTAPRGGITGQFTLQVEGDPSGATAVQVEEYKRPKFQVTLESPADAPRLGGPVRVAGKAVAYTGAAIDSAQVRYRVTREVAFPWWWRWPRPASRPPSEGEEIAHGTTQSQTDGAFEITFTAKPDLSVSKSDEPTFTFRVNVDVTDGAGETRSAEATFRVGYTALEARLEAAEWQVADQPVSLRVTTQSLDGRPQTTEGTVRIHRLRQPAQVQRPAIENGGGHRRIGPRRQTDAADTDGWELGDVVQERGFSTDTNGAASVTALLPVGLYRVLLQTQDRFGQKVTGQLPLQVLEPAADRLALKIPHLLTAPRWTVEPGEDFVALWGTGYDEGRAFVEVELRHRLVERFWTRAGRTQQQIRQAVTESMRGGFTLHVTRVRENRAYLDSRRVEVPWRNKELDLSWEHLTSKLEPGQKDTWALVLKPRQPAGGEPAERHAAELVATLYDASLDQFLPFRWPEQFGVFYQDFSLAHSHFANSGRWFNHLLGNWRREFKPANLTYRMFPPDVNAGGARRLGMMRRSYDLTVAEVAAPAAAAPISLDAPPELMKQVVTGTRLAQEEMDLAEAGGGAAASKPAAPAQVIPRKNLNETAFFFPQLTSDANGIVRMTFTMPEALTEWRFMGFAHDRQLRSGYLQGRTVTTRDLMVQPNPPRFLREGDELEFTAKVTNLSTNPQNGRVRLDLHQAFEDQPANEHLSLRRPELDLDVPPRESRSYGWRLKVPDGMGFLRYRVTASAGPLTDGEEGYLPVLSRRVFLTESLPLPIRGPGTRTLKFDKLLQSGQSTTLLHRNLVVQIVSHPAWYAVLALPYLMEYPHECSEQVFNRLYANAIAQHIALAQPRIRKVFDQWKNTRTLDSPLEQNEELKAVVLEETPWLRQGRKESDARRNVGILFDAERLAREQTLTLQKLGGMQLSDGRWPWFPGGPPNDYITLYIVTGFGRLRHLGVDIAVDPAVRALAPLDEWIHEHYDHIQRLPKPEDYVPTPTDALYLYARSFFLKDHPLAPNHQKAVEFLLGQARQHWLATSHRQTQGHLALAFQRWEGEPNRAVARAIVASLRERSVTNPELGRFWREDEFSWWWYRAPIETQALMIELFDEVADDGAAVEDLKVWLLKQKQTQDWKTTKATADAVYALLRKGADWLASTNLVEVELGGIRITPDPTPRKPGPNVRAPSSELLNAPEPGTGFYERRFDPADIKPRLGDITVRQIDAGVSWGSVHWQYLEDVSRVTPHTGTPLKLTKSVQVKRNTAQGPRLESAARGLAVGDELVTRIELRVDRDMEYVHLKDQRGSGTEPVNVLSQYKAQDGLIYYESTRDTASHFFIDYLPKGTYVFEYSTRVQHRGDYQTGLAEIQCMYAPEFSSHSASRRLLVH